MQGCEQGMKGPAVTVAALVATRPWRKALQVSETDAVIDCLDLLSFFLALLCGDVSGASEKSDLMHCVWPRVEAGSVFGRNALSCRLAERGLKTLGGGGRRTRLGGRNHRTYHPPPLLSPPQPGTDIGGEWEGLPVAASACWASGRKEFVGRSLGRKRCRVHACACTCLHGRGAVR